MADAGDGVGDDDGGEAATVIEGVVADAGYSICDAIINYTFGNSEVAGWIIRIIWR